MRITGKKIAGFFLQGFLALLAFSLILIALLQLSLMAGFTFLNTGKGRDLIQDQLNALAQPSGYHITLHSLFYDPIRGFTLRGLSISDEAGEFLTLDQASLSLSFEKLLARHLDLSFSAGTLTLSRLPQTALTKEQEDLSPSALTPFDLPDIYVRRISLSRVAFDQVILAESVAGTPLTLAPRLAASVSLENTLNAKLSLQPNASPLGAAPLPDTVELNATFDPATLQLTLSKAAIRSKAYTIEAQGTGILYEAGSLAYTLNANYNDLTSLTNDALRSATLDAALSGTYIKPALSLNGHLAPGSLAEQGLGDILLSVVPDLESDIPKALVKIESVYKDAPILATTHVSYQEPTLQIESLAAQAPYILAEGHAAIDTDTMLADGALKIEAKDFAHYKDLIGQDLTGSLLATLTAKPVDGKQSITLTAAAKSLRYAATRIAKLDANAFIADITKPWPQDGSMTLSNAVLSPEFSITTAKADIEQANDNAYRLSLSGNGKMPRPFSIKGQSTLSDFTGAFPSAKNIDAVLTLAKSAITLKGDITPQTVDLNAATKDLRITALPIDLARSLAPVRLSGGVTMTGTPGAPVTKADIALSGFDTGKYSGLGITVKATHEQGKATINVTGNGTGIRTMDADAQIPLAFSLYPFAFTLDQNASLAGALNIDLDIAPLAKLFLPPTQIFEGALKADGTLAGTIAKPDMRADIALTQGLYKNIESGIDIADLRVDAVADPGKITINSLSATDGEAGKMTGSGTIGLSAGAQSNLSLTAQNFHVPKEGIADGYVSADLSLTDNPGGYKLGGDIILEEMQIQIPERFQSNIPELNIKKRKTADEDNTPAKAIILAIKIIAENQIFVRGWGLDAEFGGEIAVSGDISAPQFDGTLKSRRGRYDEFGKKFELARADLRFQGSIPPSPYLDVEATTQAEDVLASVLLSGSVQKPGIGFSSVPSLPEDEVLARILFGKSATRISPFQAIQLTQTLQRFSGKGGGGFDPLGTLRNLTGLDDISVDTDEAGETNVGVGKYLTDKVYLEFERGKGENSGAASLQVEVTPSVNVETEVGQDARAGGGIFWKRDY